MLRLPDPEALGPEPGPVAMPEATATRREPPAQLVGGNVAPFVPRRPRNPLFRQIDVDTGVEATVEPLRPDREPGHRGTEDTSRRDQGRARGRGVRRVREGRPRAAPAGRGAPECQACPIGIAFSAVQSARPETFDHLMGATRELVAAVRSFMEGIESTLERSGSGAHTRIEHFEVE